MKKITLLLSLSFIILFTSCQTPNFTFSGNVGVSTSKTKNGKTKSTGIEFNGTPDTQELSGRHSSSVEDENGQKASELGVQGGITKKKKQAEDSGN